MDIALGLKAHSGWAALVAIGGCVDDPRVVDRRRIDLVPTAQASWAKAPYHAADGLASAAAHDLVGRAIATARRETRRELQKAVSRLVREGHAVTACAVLVGEPMPDWNVDEILAVHFRMHKAEGDLFRSALVQAARACSLTVVPIVEKRLAEHVAAAFGKQAARVSKAISELRRSAGPPWGKDQKEAALAAMMALTMAPSSPPTPPTRRRRLREASGRGPRRPRRR